jgi:two-component system, OmpR family, response regulator
VSQGAAGSSGSWPIADAVADVPRLLIVEDNDDWRRMTTAYFAEHGWHVRATRTLGSALTICETHRPHVIISELMLPDVRGYRFVDTFRRALNGHPVKVIAVTRMPELLFERAKQIGFDEVIAKPVDLDTLRSHAEQR